MRIWSTALVPSSCPFWHRAAEVWLKAADNVFSSHSGVRFLVAVSLNRPQPAFGPVKNTLPAPNLARAPPNSSKRWYSNPIAEAIPRGLVHCTFSSIRRLRFSPLDSRFASA